MRFESYESGKQSKESLRRDQNPSVFQGGRKKEKSALLYGPRITRWDSSFLPSQGETKTKKDKNRTYIYDDA